MPNSTPPFDAGTPDEIEQRVRVSPLSAERIAPNVEQPSDDAVTRALCLYYGLNPRMPSEWGPDARADMRRVLADYGCALRKEPTLCGYCSSPIDDTAEWGLHPACLNEIAVALTVSRSQTGETSR